MSNTISAAKANKRNRNIDRNREDFHRIWIKDLTDFTDVVGGDPDELHEILTGNHVLCSHALCLDDYWWSAVHYVEETVIPHKIAVYEAGAGFLEDDWFKNLHVNDEKFLDRLWTHDLSKLSAEELVGYSQHDFSRKYDDPAFERAWLHHKNHNEHHPEYWMSVNRDGTTTLLEMPKICIAEMVADWVGAGKTYGNTLEKWLPGNISSFKFASKTRITVAKILNQMNMPVKFDIQDERIICISADEEFGK